MRASLNSVLRVCREVAYGVDAASATMHGRTPAPPPYLPPAVFATPLGALRERPPVVRAPGAEQRG